MSISQLFQPNNYRLYCESLVSSSGVDSLQNIVVSTKSNEVELLTDTEYTNVYQTPISGSDSSTYRIEFMLNLFCNIDPGGLITFEIMRGVTSIFSYNVASTSGTFGMYTQNPLTLVTYDTPELVNVTYSLKITTASTVNACYLSRDSLGLSSQVIITEVYPSAPIALAIPKPRIITHAPTPNNSPPEYQDPIIRPPNPVFGKTKK